MNYQYSNKEEQEIAEKLMSAKTGEPIIIPKSYAVLDSEGNDNGKRYISRKQAEEIAEQMSEAPKELSNEPMRWWRRALQYIRQIILGLLMVVAVYIIFIIVALVVSAIFHLPFNIFLK